MKSTLPLDSKDLEQFAPRASWQAGIFGKLFYFLPGGKLKNNNNNKSCLAELQKETFPSAVPKGQRKFIYIGNSTTSTTHCCSTQSELSLQRWGRGNINMKKHFIQNEQRWSINSLRHDTACARDTDAILSHLTQQRFFFSSLIWGYAHVEILWRYPNETTTFSFINQKNKMWWTQDHWKNPRQTVWWEWSPENSTLLL